MLGRLGRRLGIPCLSVQIWFRLPRFRMRGDCGARMLGRPGCDAGIASYDARARHAIAACSGIVPYEHLSSPALAAADSFALALLRGRCRAGMNHCAQDPLSPSGPCPLRTLDCGRVSCTYERVTCAPRGGLSLVPAFGHWTACRQRACASRTVGPIRFE